MMGNVESLCGPGAGLRYCNLHLGKPPALLSLQDALDTGGW